MTPVFALRQATPRYPLQLAFRRFARMPDAQMLPTPDQTDLEKQADIVKKLKSEKADKSVIDMEVAKLLELKASLGVSGDGRSKSKSSVLKTAKGTRDYDAWDMAIRSSVFDKIQGVFKSHGGLCLDTPVFELKETLMSKYGEDSKLIYELKDSGGEVLAMRYDLTVPFARYLAQNKISNIKRYSIAKVYRRDQPKMTKGRYREFYQCDFDIAGDYSPMLPDSECVKIVCEIMDKLDLPNFLIKVNHRAILDSIMAVAGVPSKSFRTICSSIDKLDKETWEHVKDEMVNEKNLPVEVADKIGQYVKLNGKTDLIKELTEDSQLMKVKGMKNGLQDMELFFEYCDVMGITDRVCLDLSLARGLDYYTGLIYEAILTNVDEVNKLLNDNLISEEPDGDPDSAQSVGVGSISGGGRYDGLVSTFDTKQKVPCVGVSIGIERLFRILEARARQAEKVAKAENSSEGLIYKVLKTVDTQIYVSTAQKGLAKHRLKLVSELWQAGFKAEHPLKTNVKFLDSIQYCERELIPVCLILGGSELENNQVTVRNVKTKEETLIDRAVLIDHLKQILSDS